MPNTSGGLPYPAGSDAPDVPGDMQALAEELDTQLASKVDKTVIDAKGDLIVGTAADTVARLAKGTDGLFLKADSSTNTGLAWAAPVPSGNFTEVTLNSGTTWTVPAGVNVVDVMCIGGGGGGGGGCAVGSSGTNYLPGGAGGASSSVGFISDYPVTPGGSVTIAIGAGGNGGSGGTANINTGNGFTGSSGGIGGTTSFGNFSVTGGPGGVAGQSNLSVTAITNATAGTTFVRHTGGNGGRGQAYSGNYNSGAVGNRAAALTDTDLAPWAFTRAKPRVDNFRTSGGGGGGGPSNQASSGDGGNAGSLNAAGNGGVAIGGSGNAGGTATAVGCGGGGGGSRKAAAPVSGGAGGAGGPGRIVIWYRGS